MNTLLLFVAVISLSAASEVAEEVKEVCTVSDMYYVYCGEQGSQKCRKYRDVDVACQAEGTRTAQVRCRSLKAAYRECRVPKAFEITGVSVQREFNRSRGCDFNFGFKGTSIWVQNNCRGSFDVQIKPIINGGWSRWSKWTSVEECPYLCGLQGLKKQERSRTCDNPPPSNGGADCSGDDIQRRNVKCGARKCRKRCQNGMYLAHSRNKYLFYQCSNNIAHLMKCAPGTQFDLSIPGCKHDDSPFCSTNEEVIQTDASDCSKYWICSSNMKLEMWCPDSTRIDPATGTCVLKNEEC